jgi:two-component system response regulator FixJ
MNSQSNLDGKVIAFVDDQEAIRDSMRGFLEAYGATVLTYKGGNDFLRDLPTADCVVVDFYMRELNGLELASELQRRGHRVPVILLTGMSGEIPRNWAALGIAEVMDKLSGSDELLRTIHRHANLEQP